MNTCVLTKLIEYKSIQSFLFNNHNNYYSQTSAVTGRLIYCFFVPQVAIVFASFLLIDYSQIFLVLYLTVLLAEVCWGFLFFQSSKRA